MFQTDKNCIFCKIIAQEIPARIIAENESTIVIEDIKPKAPIHYLIIPKQHIENIKTLSIKDKEYAADVMYMAQTLSQQNEKAQEFRLVSNNGASAGQEVFHMHIHFLAGF